MNKITIRTTSITQHERLVMLLTYLADPRVSRTRSVLDQLGEDIQGATITHHQDGRRGKKPSRTQQ